MASKRAQILEQALHLFNEKGVGETSTHDIARAAGVAQGNLTYHFPKRPDLVEALYFELIEELDELFKRLGPGDLSFKALFDAQLGQARLQKKYRFLFLDFGRIKRQSSAITTHFASLMTQREAQFQLLIQGLQAINCVRTMEKQELDYLFEHLSLVGNFWTSAAEVFQPAQPEQHYARVTLALLYPYLTEEGRRQWSEVVN